MTLEEKIQFIIEVDDYKNILNIINNIYNDYYENMSAVYYYKGEVVYDKYIYEIDLQSNARNRYLALSRHDYRYYQITVRDKDTNKFIVRFEINRPVATNNVRILDRTFLTCEYLFEYEQSDEGPTDIIISKKEIDFEFSKPDD